MVVGKWPREPSGPINSPLTFPPNVPSPACRRLIAQLLDDDEERRAGYEDCLWSGEEITPWSNLIPEWLAVSPVWIFADQNFVYSVLHQN
ncbi:unnamed protein product, partial [Mesorhabditis spiculigera]